MPRILLGNFDFEHELAVTRAALQTEPFSNRTQLSDRAWVWTAIAESDDVVITGARIDADDFAPLARLGLPIPRFCSSPDQLPKGEQWQLVPWGWTGSLVRMAKQHGWSCAAPPADVVRRVNSREFRFGLECDWNIGLRGAAIARSITDLEVAITHAAGNPRGWLLKANFGMSGREAMRGRGGTLADNLRNWAERRLAASGPIVFEPIVERVAEAGIQIEIPQTGEPKLMGVTPLLVDASGVYRGSRFGCPAEEIACWEPAVEVSLRTANELQRSGYFGPLGIDAMRYRNSDGEVRLRPLQDLNARYTMGRLALGFCRVLRCLAGQVGAGESKNILTSPPLAPPYEEGERSCGSWLHFGARQLAGHSLAQLLNEMQPAMPAGAIAVPASPQNAGTSPAHAVLVIAPSPELRDAAEAAVFNAIGIAVSR